MAACLLAGGCAATQQTNGRYLEGIEPGPARAALENMDSFPAEDGRILYDLITAKGYKRGVEIGTGWGNASVWLGIALRKNGGKLITIEIDAWRAKTATQNFKKAGLDDVIECRTADAFQEIPRLEGTFDFVFMDTGNGIHKKLMDLLWERLTPGAAITSHNANTFERHDPDFWRAITTGPNLDTKITRTPGGGISVSIKKKE